MYDAVGFFEPFPAYYSLNVLLAVLQVMHIIWFNLIIKVAYNTLVNGDKTKDERSVSSEGSSHEHDE